MKLSSFAAFAVMSAVLAVPAKAHHSFNTFFDPGYSTDTRSSFFSTLSV
jgi:hypothetical protein